MSSATFKNNSWGRTRGPKSIVNTNGAPVTVLTTTGSLEGITPEDVGSAGYATENQKYLHVLLEDAHGSDPTGINLKIYGYCHAFARWFPIYSTTRDDWGTNSGVANSSFDVADSGFHPESQGPHMREYRRYYIEGIDRVAFQHDNPDRVNVFAACSTIA